MEKDDKMMKTNETMKNEEFYNVEKRGMTQK